MTKLLSDPTVTAILVVGAYGTAAGLAWSRANIARRLGNIPHQSRMLAYALLFLILALSYQLEFIPNAIAGAKALAKDQGWYNYRWSLAGSGVLIFGVGAALGLNHYRPTLRRGHPAQWVVGIGLAVLTGYFLLRATSIHWVDPWSGIHFGCPRTNPWIELTSALCLAVGLWFVPTRVNRNENVNS